MSLSTIRLTATRTSWSSMTTRKVVEMGTRWRWPLHLRDFRQGRRHNKTKHNRKKSTGIGSFENKAKRFPKRTAFRSYHLRLFVFVSAKATKCSSIAKWSPPCPPQKQQSLVNCLRLGRKAVKMGWPTVYCLLWKFGFCQLSSQKMKNCDTWGLNECILLKVGVTSIKPQPDNLATLEK